MKKLLLNSILALFLFLGTGYCADFTPVWEKTILPHEGGYSNNIHDPGNWTGGKENKGRFLGTKYGISASQYGTSLLKRGIIIKHLTKEQARALFEKDYWLKYNFDKLKSQRIAEELCDSSVNIGGAGTEKLLAKIFIEIQWATKQSIPVLPKFNPETIQWINSYTESRINRISFYNSLRLKRVKYYVDIINYRPQSKQFFVAWITRTVD